MSESAPDRELRSKRVKTVAAQHRLALASRVVANAATMVAAGAARSAFAANALRASGGRVPRDRAPLGMRGSGLFVRGGAEDPVSLNRIPAARAVRMGRQYWNSRTLRRLLAQNPEATNPLTRQPLPAAVVEKYGIGRQLQTFIRIGRMAMGRPSKEVVQLLLARGFRKAPGWDTYIFGFSTGLNMVYIPRKRILELWYQYDEARGNDGLSNFNALGILAVFKHDDKDKIYIANEAPDRVKLQQAALDAGIVPVFRPMKRVHSLYRY